ncbi:MAG: hypothetical protein V7641_3403 [Blastocatellia bacterium]
MECGRREVTAKTDLAFSYIISWKVLEPDELIML